MKIGLGIALDAPRNSDGAGLSAPDAFAAGDWTLAEKENELAGFFSADEPGFIVDPSDTSSLWQDTSASTPANADLDPVALVQDVSGSANGVDHQTTVSTERPTYQTDGTLHWLENDGVDDALESPVNLDMTGTDTFTAVFSIRSLETGGTRALFYRHNVSGGNKLFDAPVTNPIKIRAFTAQENTLIYSETDAAFDPPVDFVMRVEGDIPNDRMRVWLDGVLVATETGYGTTTNWQSAVSQLFFGTGAVRFYGGLMIGRLLTTGEADEADTWAADRQGRTL